MNTKIAKFARKNALVIFLAIVPPLVIWFILQREVKGLSVNIEADVPVISLDKRFAEGIEILYRSKPISSLHVVDLSVENYGDKPIKRSDFDDSIKFDFSGHILSQPLLLRVKPNNLKPVLKLDKTKTITLDPLLLNDGEMFAFRTYLADRPASENTVNVTGRVTGVKEIIVNKIRKDEKYNYIFGVISGIAGAISVSAMFLLFYRSRGIIMLPLASIKNILGMLEMDLNTRLGAIDVAQQLQIVGHNYKSNLLLLRIKIEDQLRTIADMLNIPKRSQLVSISRIASILHEKNVLSAEINSAIRDISPTLNRELHDIESYLNDEEYQTLQNLGLTIVAKLDSIIQGLKNKIVVEQHPTNDSMTE